MLNFINRFATLPESFYSRQQPDIPEGFRWLCGSDSAAREMNLELNQEGREALLQLCSGHNPSADPLAMVYSGHQFGGYTPQLGDGRGLLLGEVTGARQQTFELHLKGAGMTPFSRRGDGRAVLRSSIREFLGSEYLAALGLPTTRALCLLGSDEPVYREKEERAALIVRMATTHIRFGHFEFFYFTQQQYELKKLVDFVLETYFPHCLQEVDPIGAMFASIVEKTAKMIAGWQAYGFCHGVMNTDNFSIVGETFDFGPYAFLDDYNPRHICNHSDYEGRYSFYRQPVVAHWNLQCLARALSGFIGKEAILKALNSYEGVLVNHFNALMAAKLGFSGMDAEHHECLKGFLNILAANQMDYSLSLRSLSQWGREGSLELLRSECRDLEAIDEWIDRYTALASVEVEIQARMDEFNPRFVLRNYLLQQAIEKAEQGDMSEVERLLLVMSQPFAEQSDNQHYALRPPEWGKHLEISCSS
ncbi:protein adenylyltransferase SelO [Pokkaliibacter sp. CJK22405]|uniref:protein adenylyltransferase SelO n=1 Tax=Pokkaliibacter sp. CJK22405 TaxID=3384615 RepID=UPI0039854F71